MSPNRPHVRPNRRPRHIPARYRPTRRVLAAGLLLGATIGWTTPASAQQGDDLATQIADVVESASDDLDIPGVSYAVVVEGETVALGAAGVTNRDTQQLVDPDRTVFRVGSVSKPITALATLLAEDEGLIDLDQAVDDYVDIDLAGSSEITIGSLLTHTAGYEANSIGLVAPEADDIEPLSDYVRDRQPSRFEETGVVHSYSNYGYALAGHTIETVTDTDFSTHLAARLFTPLGMDSTSFDLDLPPNLATGYDGLAGARSPAEDVFLRPYPAGGAVTTAADMTQLLAAMTGHRPDVVPEPVTTRLVATGFRSHPDVLGRTVGGLEEMAVDGVRVVGHSGDIAGFGAQLALVPDHDIGIFFAANAVDFELNDRLITNIVGLLTEPETITDPEFISVRPGELDEVAGAYRWTRYSRTQVDKILAIFPTQTFTVSVPDDESIVIEIGGVDQTWTYRPTGDLVFAQVEGQPAIVNGLVIDPGERISFTRNADGDVAYLNLAMSTIAGERISSFLTGSTQSLLGMTLLGLFLLSLPLWGAVALWRRRRPAQLTTDEIWLRRAVVAHTAILLLAMAATIIGLLGPVPFGLPAPAVVGLALLTIASTLGLALIPAAAIAWHQHMLALPERITVTTLALATPILLWWLNSWNLFGFHL